MALSRLTLLVAVACLVVAPVAWAAEQAAPAANSDPASAPAAKKGGGKDGTGNVIDGVKAALAKLELTAEQKTKTDELVTKAAADLKAQLDKNADQIKALKTQLDEARTNKDKAKAKDLRDQLAKLMPNVADTLKSLRDQIKPILTDEQNKKLESALVPPEKQAANQQRYDQVVKANADALALTADQKSKIDGLQKDFKTAVKDAADKAKRKELVDKLTADVKALLTDDQKAKAEKLMAATESGKNPPVVDRLTSKLKDLNLTDTQDKQIKDLIKAFEDSAKGTTGQARRDLVQKLNKDIRNVLTPEQRAKFNPKGAGQGGGRRGGSVGVGPVNIPL